MPKYKVPSNIVSIARDAIEYNLSFPVSQRAAMKEENGKIVFGTGMRTARRLVSGSIDREQMVLMRAWFARHAESPGEKEARQDKTSKASRSWLLWGGNPAKRWVESTLRDIEREEAKDKK